MYRLVYDNQYKFQAFVVYILYSTYLQPDFHLKDLQFKKNVKPSD